MRKVDELIKVEAKKRETVGTIVKLLDFSKSKSACYLCKKALDSSETESMTKNFPVEG